MYSKVTSSTSHLLPSSVRGGGFFLLSFYREELIILLTNLFFFLLLSNHRICSKPLVYFLALILKSHVFTFFFNGEIINRKTRCNVRIKTIDDGLFKQKNTQKNKNISQNTTMQNQPGQYTSTAAPQGYHSSAI